MKKSWEGKLGNTETAQELTSAESHSLTFPKAGDSQESCINRSRDHMHCYGLDIKCPPKAHVLKAWSSAGGTIER
jgi:hypothetical protein